MLNPYQFSPASMSFPQKNSGRFRTYYARTIHYSSEMTAPVSDRTFRAGYIEMLRFEELKLRNLRHRRDQEQDKA